MANEQEREEIRNGFDAVTADSARPLRECIIAQALGHQIPQKSLQRLIELEETALVLRARNAALNGQPAPERPAWLDPAPPGDGGESN